MKSFSSAATTFKVRRAAWWTGAALFATSISAVNAAEIDVWHSLSPHNKAVFERLVKQFNKDSDENRVKLTAFDNSEAIDAALSKIELDRDRPHLVQLDEARSPNIESLRSYIQPLHVLLAHHPIDKVDWFLSSKNTAGRDDKGRLVAFPFMLDIPVMFYNVDAFKKAGLNPAKPERAWNELQAQVVTAANNGSRACPITSDQPVSINLENLAAVNKQPFTSAQNPRSAKGAPTFNFDALYIRHLSLMISWVRSELLVKPELNDVAAHRFANGECAVLLSQSSNLGWFESQRQLDFGVTGLPYYPEVTSTPGLPFVGGAALWSTGGHAKEDDAATADFLKWLVQTDHATEWYQETGYLPLTKQAFENAGGRGDVKAQWKELVAPYADEPVATARGFQIKNYPEIRALFKQSIGRALSGDEPAMTILRSASTEASKIAQ